MSTWWIISLLEVFVFIPMVNSKFDLDTPVVLAHCRASCLYKMKTLQASDIKCKKSSFCSQCWNSCGFLQTVNNSGPFCKRNECGPGCLEACRFYTLSPSHLSPVPLEEVLVMSDSRVSWASMSGPIAVYVVMADGSQLCQTLEHSTGLPPNVDFTTVRVLVVNWRGLVKVLAPVAEPTVDQALYILRSLGMEDKRGHTSQPSIERELSTMENFVNQIRVDSSWRIRVLSLHHQPTLTLAQIDWKSYHYRLLRNSQFDVSYLVSWAADGDVVRGNLLTNTSTVTLSLWPDTTYRIQVALFNLQTPAIQSEPLIVDTHQVLETTVNTTSSQANTLRLPNTTDHIHQPSDDSRSDSHLHSVTHMEGREGVAAGREAVAGLSAAVLVFLGVVLMATWRWRHYLYLPHNKLLDKESDAPNIYRVFPPLMRLIGETDTGMSSSRDNLLQQQ